MSYPFTIAGFHQDDGVPQPLEVDCTCIPDTTSEAAQAIRERYPNLTVLQINAFCPAHTGLPASRYPEDER